MSDTLRAAAFLDKGGTGKTTTVAHLGVALEELGHEVLLIDLAGKQGDLAKHFGVWGDYQARIEADEVICLETPSPFYAVGQAYRSFDQVSDEEVIGLLRDAGPRTSRD